MISLSFPGITMLGISLPYTCMQMHLKGARKVATYAMGSTACEGPSTTAYGESARNGHNDLIQTSYAGARPVSEDPGGCMGFSPADSRRRQAYALFSGFEV